MKPSPAQAILLQDLSGEGVQVSATVFRRGQVKDAVLKGPGGSGLYKRLTPITFQAVLKNGWVEKIEGQSIFEARYVLSQTGREALAKLVPADFEPNRPELSAGQIARLLSVRYPLPEWIFFEELRCGTGYYSVSAEQRIDAFAMNCWPSNNFTRIAFEIKVYRSDFLKEIKHPEKRAYALKMSNQFFFAAPKGLIKPAELPEECGLVECSLDGQTRVVKQAPMRKTGEPSWSFLASLARRMAERLDKLPKQAEEVTEAEVVQEIGSAGPLFDSLSEVKA